MNCCEPLKLEWQKRRPLFRKTRFSERQTPFREEFRRTSCRAFAGSSPAPTHRPINEEEVNNSLLRM
jgi:hypothetical protein